MLQINNIDNIFRIFAKKHNYLILPIYYILPYIVDRVKSTLVEIGSPVFSGGFSTFLAFILLVGSNSYVFTTFFKVSLPDNNAIN